MTTLASSSLIQSFKRTNNLFFHETPVGFKHFTSYLKDAQLNNLNLLAVESSGGFTISTHTLEKCGFIPVLVLLCIMAYKECTLSDLVKEIEEKYGYFYFEESQFEFDQQLYKKAHAAFLSLEPEKIIHDFDLSISNLNMQDGIKNFIRK